MAQRTATIARSADRLDDIDVAGIAARIPEAPGGVRGGREEIAAVVAAIAECFRPEQIVLFGSRAYGTPTPESDIDLMVIMVAPLGQREQLAEIRAFLGRSDYWINIHTRTPEGIALGLAEGDFFIQDVMLKGIPLYDNGRFRVMTDAGDPGGWDPSKPKEATLVWFRKADIDLRVARLLVAGPDPDADPICFHAQQCGEKYLKGFLQQHDIRFPRTHKLEDLAPLALEVLPTLASRLAELTWLSPFAVDSRYAEADATVADAEHATGIATDIRTLIRAALGLE